MEKPIAFNYENYLKALKKIEQLQSRLENAFEFKHTLGNWQFYIFQNKICKAKLEEIIFNPTIHGKSKRKATYCFYDFSRKIEITDFDGDDLIFDDNNEDVIFYKTKSEAEQALAERKNNG